MFFLDKILLLLIRQKLFFVIILFFWVSYCGKKIDIIFSTNTEISEITLRYIEQFEKENPNIKIHYQKMPTWKGLNLHQSYLSFLSSGDVKLDIFPIDIIWITEFWKSGWLLDLRPYLSRDELEEFISPLMRSAIIDENVIGIPGVVDTGLLYYRKDITKKPPKTWKELIKTASKYKKKYPYTILFPGENYESLVCFFWEVIQSVMGQEAVPTQSHLRKSLQIFKSLLSSNKKNIRKSLSLMKEDTSLKYFIRGKSLFMRNWPYAISHLEKSKLKGRFGISSLPGNSSTLGGWYMVVHSKTRHPEAAAKFIRFMNDKSRQKEQSLLNGNFPSRKELYKDEEVINRIPFVSKVIKIASDARGRPKLIDYARFSLIIRSALNQYIKNEISFKKMSSILTKDLKKLGFLR
jgi:multiple sugar transport system substrate-binding protein